jgi:hypothetical protein
MIHSSAVYDKASDKGPVGIVLISTWDIFFIANGNPLLQKAIVGVGAGIKNPN